MLQTLPLEDYKTLLEHLHAYQLAAHTQTTGFFFPVPYDHRSCIRASHRIGRQRHATTRTSSFPAQQMRTRRAHTRPKPTRHWRMRQRPANSGNAGGARTALLLRASRRVCAPRTLPELQAHAGRRGQLRGTRRGRANDARASGSDKSSPGGNAQPIRSF